MTKHRIIKGICYLYEIKEVYRGRCPQHSPKKAKAK
jgi:hypothetical protein